MRIATLQLNPKIGAVSENISRANTILNQALSTSKLSSNKLDLLILPELGLTGYNFSSPTHIQPYLESPLNLGPTLKWAQETSKKFNCFTVLGYPEVTSDSQIHNSAIVFNKNGEIVHNYRKSFLYETDETWGANEGPGFETFQLTDDIKASIGICMDLNPYKFEAPFEKFEFSNFCKDQDVNLVICPTAWLHSASPSILESITDDEKTRLKEAYHEEIANCQKDFTIDDKSEEITKYELVKEFKELNQPDYSTLNYWILRFFPFVNQFWRPNNSPHKTTVILNNRTGIEDDVMYCGSSTIFQFYGKDRTGRNFDFQSTYFKNDNVKVLGALGKGNEGILIRDVEL